MPRGNGVRRELYEGTVVSGFLILWLLVMLLRFVAVIEPASSYNAQAPVSLSNLQGKLHEIVGALFVKSISSVLFRYLMQPV